MRVDWDSLSRSPVHLWGISLGIVCLGVIVGVILRTSGGWGDSMESFRHSVSSGKPQSLPSIKDNQTLAYETLEIFASISTPDPAAWTRIEESAVRSVPNENKEVFRLYIRSLAKGDNRLGGDARLLEIAEQEPKVLFANYAVGLLYELSEDKERAAKAFLREGQFQNADRARSKALQLLIATNDLETIETIRNDTLYQSLFTVRVDYQLAAMNRQWGKMFLLLYPMALVLPPISLALLALLSGCMWFLFCAHCLFAAHSIRDTLLIGLAGVVLGALSAPMVLAVISISETVFNFYQRSDLVGGLIYYVFGVGLREELLKLLFFIPLGYVLARRSASDFTVLMAAAFVGLGFAIEENLGYYKSFGALVGPARFLTANFFHMAATAVIGFAFYQSAFRRGGWDTFANVFGQVVILHGLYDALLSLPALIEYEWFSSMAYIYLCYLFFTQLRAMRPNTRDRFSLTFTFVVGVSTVFSATMAYLCAQIGFGPSVQVVTSTALQLALIIYMFIREMPGSLMR